ncbi:MAG TPA: fatty acyl-AMP ligase [Humisphaera sp.]|jgi:acyl-CoA synthetase (AMP-forming)/AMP-acid ligase II|nr:fatty acyl-AMP ligase [Humisphaera sp.]
MSRDQTLAHCAATWAAERGDAIAYTFLADGAADIRSLTWAELHRRAAAGAGLLAAAGAVGKPVLLMLPSGLEFVASLFACWYAGAIPVPVCLPRHHRTMNRLHALIGDAGARHAFAEPSVQQRFSADEATRDATAGLTWMNLTPADCEQNHVIAPQASGRDIGLIQYTSGSTGTPRGVVVTNANLMSNSAAIAEACGHDQTSTIGGWLPLFHDMGLIGLLAQAAFTGARCVFMAPERFLMRPWAWLQMISDYQICSSPAPNFGYDLCVDKVSEQQKQSVDLSGWRNALNGSEPVRPATLERFAAAFASRGFRASAFFPCYGLAEATLFVTGPGGKRRLTVLNSDGTRSAPGSSTGHVGCGHAFGDTRVAIVDPQTRRRLPDRVIGEIWVAGSSCAQGYWGKPQAAATFAARIEADEAGDDSTWLRTGDLGMLVDGELYITGRLRELIILAGRNLFPVDLEQTAENASPAIASSATAAFSIDIDAVERLIVAAEIRRELVGRDKLVADGIDVPAIARNVRAAVAAEHDVMPHEVVLLRPGALPRTTSGKINRGATRQAYLEGTLDRLEARSHVVAKH